MTTNNCPTQTDLVGLAYQAGEIMLKAFKPGMKCEWKAEDNTPLTVSDTRINQIVIEWFERHYPHISVMGEEESRIVDGSEYVVVVDPIDGTIPFRSGIPVSTFCISVLKNGVPILAVIHDPYLNRTWFAERGCGTRLNGEPVRVAEKATLAQSNLSIMWWKEAIGSLDKVCSELVDRRIMWLNLYSVAIAGGLIASGDLVASVFPGTKIMETPAMELLVTEAGGIATDLNGNTLVYGKDLTIHGHLMSANAAIHDELLGMISRANRI